MPWHLKRSCLLWPEILLRLLELLLLAFFFLSHPLPVLSLSSIPLSHLAPSYPILFTAYLTFLFSSKVLPFSFSPIVDDHFTLRHPNLFYPPLISPPSLIPTCLFLTLHTSLPFLTHTPGLSIAPYLTLLSSLPYLTRTPGLSIAPLSASDRKEVMSISHRWFLEDFDVVAFAYTPVHNHVSRQLRYPLF